MPPRYQLRCLGEPGLYTLGGRPIKLRTRKQLALLCYLAMEPRHHTRDALAELLWPDVPQGEGRHSLATALSGLRGKLGKEAFDATSERVRLRPGAVTLDVDRLLKGEVLATEFEEALDVDGFLQSFELPDALPFSHWRDGEHARLLPNVRDALVILIDHCRRTGDFRQIETLALRLLRFDSLSEEGIRARMEARAFAGDRLTALRLFQDWKAALSSQLGAVPSPLLEGMALRLRRREWERPEAPDVPAVRTDQWRGRPFVGRGREYRELYEAWEATQRAAPRHRLLLGDSGIGKSTLVERLTTAAGLEGATVARVQCHEVEREIPYTMVSGLIAQLVERPGASAAPPDALAELAQTIPAVRQRFPVLPPPLESQGDAARIRFTEAAHALMAAVAEEHPVILVIDDVHHADDVSLAVLHRVVRLADTQQILMLFVARPAELHQSPQAARLRDNGASLGIHPLELLPLAEEDARALLELLVVELQLSPSATVRRALLGAAAGFPLVLELLVRDWARSGPQCLALSLDAVTADAGRKSEPDEAYQLLLDRLVRTLDPGTRNTLHVAAVLGPRLNDAALYALADLKVSDVMTGLTTLVQCRILRDGGDHLEFANDLVRAHAYYAVPSPMRLLLHGLIADVLLARAGGGDDSLGLEIAWHCMRCGRKEEATKHLLSGARAAISQGAVHEAERRVYTALPNLSGNDRFRALLLMGELLQEQSRWQESMTALASDPTVSASLHGRLLYANAQLRAELCVPSDYEAMISLAMDALTTQGEPALIYLTALQVSCGMCAQTRDVRLAARFEKALEGLGVEDFDEDQRIDLDLSRVQLRYFQLPSGSALSDTINELRALAERADVEGRPNSRACRILAGLSACLISAARIEEALHSLPKALKVCQILDSGTSRASILVHMALCHGLLGQHEEQRVNASAALANIPLETPCYSKLLGMHQLGMASARLGHSHEAHRLALALSAWHGLNAPTWLIQTALLYASEILVAADRVAEARELSWRALEMGDGLPLSPKFTGLAARCLALNLARPERTGAAAAALKRLATAWPRLDVLDEIELVDAQLRAARATGCVEHHMEAKLATCSARLSPALKQHLRINGIAV